MLAAAPYSAAAGATAADTVSRAKCRTHNRCQPRHTLAPEITALPAFHGSARVRVTAIAQTQRPREQPERSKSSSPHTWQTGAKDLQISLGEVATGTPPRHLAGKCRCETVRCVASRSRRLSEHCSCEGTEILSNHTTSQPTESHITLGSLATSSDSRLGLSQKRTRFHDDRSGILRRRKKAS